VKHLVTIDGVFPLERGGTLHDAKVEVRTWGKHAASATLICHALTGDANADEWWSGLFGKGRVFDPTRSFIVATNVIGGLAGSTGPTSPNPTGDGVFGPAFPDVTIRDMVRIQRHVLEQLGVSRLDLVIGGSMGGMQALEWAAMYPEMVEEIVPIGVGSEQSPWAIAFSEVQRRAIINDPNFKAGWYDADNAPTEGLGIARMVAMTSYRSAAEFGSRFGRTSDTNGFAVQSYLQHQGTKFNERFDANTYLTLLDAMDSHDMGRGRGPTEAILRRIGVAGVVVGISTDVLYPVGEVRALADSLPHCRFAVLDSAHGHDGFLIDTDRLNELILANRSPVVKPIERTGQGSSWA
jgi:homoserine O-acetyltransferase